MTKRNRGGDGEMKDDELVKGECWFIFRLLIDTCLQFSRIIYCFSASRLWTEYLYNIHILGHFPRARIRFPNL